jgi:hypothetical protein
MKKLLVTTMALALVFVAFKSNAQVSFGVKAGLNLANVNQDYKASDEEMATKMGLGYNAGLSVDYGLNDAISIKSGLEWSVKGYAVDLEEEFSDVDGAEVDGKSTAAVNYIELPINVAYKISGLQIFAGPYVGYMIGGKVVDDFTVSVDGTEFISSDGETTLVGKSDGYKAEDLGENEMAVNMLDYGLNIGAGYEVGPILISAQYNLGLSNLTVMPDASETNAADYKTTNSVINVSASFFF